MVHSHRTPGAPADSRRARRVEDRRRRRARGGRRMLTAAAALSAWAVVSVAATGGTYALWSDSRTLDAGMIRSGTSDLSISGVIPPTAFANLLPGERVAAAVSVHNSGTTSLALDGTLAAAAAGFDVRLALNASACGTTPLGSAPLASATPASLGSLGPGSSAPLCVEVTAQAVMVPGATAAFVVEVAGEQS